MKQEEIYLITYKETESVEGFVLNKFDFNKWLKRHNQKRKEEGEIIENKNEFDITLIQKLI